jgi:hypothetical protein
VVDTDNSPRSPVLPRRSALARSRRFHFTAIALLIGGFSLWWTRFSLGTRLDNDDVMNLNFAWGPPLHRLLLALLVPFTPFYRPSGAALYRFIFDLFGLNFLPFRIAVHLMLLLNLYLVYKLARTLTRSAETGAMAALLYSFHGRLTGIYLNNGAIYDVLCATLTLATLLYYVSVRESGRSIAGRRWVWLFLLFTFAINAKEMAAVIPLLLFIYEALYHGRSLRPLPPMILTVATLIATWAKMSPRALFHANPGYRMTFTLDQFLEHSRRLMTHLVYATNDGLTIQWTIAIWLAVLAIAAASRSKFLWFAASFALLAPLPVIFIPYRGFFVMYLPLAGWAIFVAGVLVGGRKWLWTRLWKRPPLPANPFEPERVFLFLAVAFLMVWMPAHDEGSELKAQDPSQGYIRRTKRDILALNEPLPRGAKLLILHDLFPADSYAPVQTWRLVYRDRDLWIDRPTMMQHPPNPAEYDRVFDYVGGKLVLVRARPGSGALIRPRS